MQEIEVKILEINRKEVEKKLLSWGAVKKFEGIIQALYFDYPDGSINKVKNTLRLRKEGEKAVLTFKKHGKDKKVKVCEELEVSVSDFEVMKQILEAMGVKQWLSMKKQRTSYSLDGTHFEFDRYVDKYDYIPEFVEIEAKDVETLYKMVNKLGFTKEDCKPWGVMKLIKYYSKNE